jgi:hypothetical protein
LGTKSALDAFRGLTQLIGVLAGIHVYELINPLIETAAYFQHWSLLHLLKQSFWDAATAHRRALGFEPNLWGLPFSISIKGLRKPIFVMLSAGLIGLTKTTEAASTVMR